MRSTRHRIRTEPFRRPRPGPEIRWRRPSRRRSRAWPFTRTTCATAHGSRIPLPCSAAATGIPRCSSSTPRSWRPSGRRWCRPASSPCSTWEPLLPARSKPYKPASRRVKRRNWPPTNRRPAAACRRRRRRHPSSRTTTPPWRPSAQWPRAHSSANYKGMAMTTFSARVLSAALATVSAGLYCAAPALADDSSQNSSPNTVRIGLYSVFFHVDADDLSGPFVPPGANLDARNVETLYLAYVRTLSSRFDVELAGGYPPLQKTVGKGPATLGSVPYDGQVIATARWIGPTGLLENKFLSENSMFRPYIGAGLNYTTFYDRNSTAQRNAISGGPTRLSLTSSVGPAGTVGVRYNIAGNWHAIASYSVSKVSTDLSADTAGEIRTTHINFGPQALVVAVGYSF